MLVSVTLNPCVDHALFVEKLALGDTNRVLRVEKDAGGKGVNVSRVFAELGGDTIATGFLGGSAASMIQHTLARENVEDGFVKISGETRTNFSIEDNSGAPPTTFNQRGPQISEAEWLALLDKVRAIGRGARWAALGGSLPPGVPDDAFFVLGVLFKELNVNVILDADGESQRLGMRAEPDLIKPNAAEASRLLNRRVESDAEAREAARELYSQLGGGRKIVVISRGKDGAVMCTNDQVVLGRSPVVKAKSTIGSGDSMIAGLVWALDSGKSTADALRWGLAAGAATAMTDGSSIARLFSIEELLDHASIEEVLD